MITIEKLSKVHALFSNSNHSLFILEKKVRELNIRPNDRFNGPKPIEDIEKMDKVEIYNSSSINIKINGVIYKLWFNNDMNSLRKYIPLINLLAIDYIFNNIIENKNFQFNYDCSVILQTHKGNLHIALSQNGLYLKSMMDDDSTSKTLDIVLLSKLREVISKAYGQYNFIWDQPKCDQLFTFRNIGIKNRDGTVIKNPYLQTTIFEDNGSNISLSIFLDIFGTTGFLSKISHYDSTKNTKEIWVSEYSAYGVPQIVKRMETGFLIKHGNKTNWFSLENGSINVIKSAKSEFCIYDLIKKISMEHDVYESKEFLDLVEFIKSQIKSCELFMGMLTRNDTELLIVDYFNLSDFRNNVEVLIKLKSILIRSK